MMFSGSFFLWSSISVYVLSYFHMMDPKKGNITEASIYFVDLALVFLNCLGHIIGAKLLEWKWDPKKVILLGGILSMIGYFIASTVKSFSLFIVFYGVIGALGCGICYMVPLVTATRWYPERKGMMTGIIVAAFGGGSAIYTIISKHIVNPETKGATVSSGQEGLTFFDKSVASRVPKLLRILATVWTVQVILGFILIH